MLHGALLERSVMVHLERKKMRLTNSLIIGLILALACVKAANASLINHSTPFTVAGSCWGVLNGSIVYTNLVDKVRASEGMKRAESFGLNPKAFQLYGANAAVYMRSYNDEKGRATTLFHKVPEGTRTKAIQECSQYGYY